MNRDNLPPEGVSLTECTPDAAGFIAGGDTKRSGRNLVLKMDKPCDGKRWGAGAARCCCFYSPY